MKKLLLIIALLIIAIGVNAQEGINLLFNPMSLKYNSAEIGFSYRDGKDEIYAFYGIPIYSSIVGKTFDDFYVNPSTYSNFNLYSRIARAGYRHYFFNNNFCKDVYTGFGVNSFTSVYYGFCYPTKDIKSAIDGSFNQVSASLELGYKLLVYNRLVVEVFGGLEPTRYSGMVNGTALNSKDVPELSYFIVKTMTDNLNQKERENTKVRVYDNRVEGKLNLTFRMEYYFGCRVGIRIN